MYRLFFKRLIDFLISFFAILVLIVPMIIIGIMIKIDSKGSVLFKQERLGRYKEKFVILKFRTMCEEAYKKGDLVASESDLRITKIGKVLRRTSIDELPQLFNIFVGQMSIIGPRPILDWEYEEYANDKYEPRFTVRPGLFCSVDVSKRAIASREDQLEMDTKYAEKVTLLTDVKLFFAVIPTVITGKNVYLDEKQKI